VKGLEVIKSDALFSPCETWRYTLFRQWKKGRRFAAFIGLNPSTADEVNNDPTVTRCINYAKRWDYDGMWMLNAFAFRSTSPKLLKLTKEPIGPDNDFWIKRIVNHKTVKLVLCCWGTHAEFKGRCYEVAGYIPSDKAMCLKLTKAGHPYHPLYLKADLKPQSFCYIISSPLFDLEPPSKEIPWDA